MNDDGVRVDVETVVWIVLSFVVGVVVGFITGGLAWVPK